MLLAFLSAASLAARPPAVGYVDSETGRIRCHHGQDEDRGRCEQVVVWAEEAWAVQVDDLGFRAPRPDAGEGGSDALDIYVSRRGGGAGSAWVDCEAGDPGCIDDDPSDGYAASASYVVIDPRTSDAVFRAYVHHEFQHTTQYATDYAEPFLSLWEGTAVACERWTEPDWPTSAKDFGDYQAVPWLSAVLQDGYFLADAYDIPDSWYEYGAVAWVFWLDHTYGAGDGAIGPRLWDELAQEGGGDDPDVLDAWDAIAAEGWRESMLKFAADRARMGSDAGPEWADFADDYAIAAREPDIVVGPATLAPARAPYPLGAVYWDIEGSPGETIELALDGDEALLWGLLVVDGADGDAIIGTSLSWRLGEEPITVGVVNLGPDGFDADDPLETSSFALTVSILPADEPDSESGDTSGSRRCGCSTPSPNAPWALVMLAVLQARRRRTIAGRPRV